MRLRYAAVAAMFVVFAAARSFAQTTLVPDPPRFVTGPEVQTMLWSPSGRYLLVARREHTQWAFNDPAPPVLSVVLWNHERREAKTLLRTERRITQISLEIHWVARTNDAFVRIPSDDPTAPAELWRVDARKGEVQRVQGIVKPADVAVSPTQPWAVVYGQDKDGGFVRSLSAAGVLGPAVALDEPTADFDAWSTDGSMAYFRHTMRPEDFPDPKDVKPLPPGTPPPPPDPDPIIPAFPAFTPATGQLTMLNRLVKWYEEPPSHAPFDLPYTTVKASDGTSDAAPKSAPWNPALHPLWLEQKGDPLFKRLFIAADAGRTAVSPRNDAIAYQNGEGAFVVNLQAVPTATLKLARHRDMQTELLNDAKQVALAAIMRAQDNNGVLPGAGPDTKALLTPYLRGGFFDGSGGGFQYTFGGGSITGVENPDQTPLGYIEGAGGRATAYLDGHVKWEP